MYSIQPLINSIIEINVFILPAPKTREDLSKLTSTDDIETTIGLTTSGKETMAAAIEAAPQVKTISEPKNVVYNFPIAPSLPSNKSKKYPVATGGRAKGNVTKVSKKILPLKCFFARIQPTSTAKGKTIMVATIAT